MTPQPRPEQQTTLPIFEAPVPGWLDKYPSLSYVAPFGVVIGLLTLDKVAMCSGHIIAAIGYFRTQSPPLSAFTFQQSCDQAFGSFVPLVAASYSSRSLRNCFGGDGCPGE